MATTVNKSYDCNVSGLHHQGCENHNMTSTVNQSFYGPVLDWKPYDRAAAIICFTLFVFIVSLNGTVIYTLVMFRKHKKSRLYFFIFHLAIADLLVGVINVLGDGIQSAMDGHWYGGDLFCRVWRYSKAVSLMASNNLLIGMSIDRFLAVKSPMIFVKNGNVLGRTLVIGAWLLSIVTSVFFLPYSEGLSSQGDQMGYCNINLPHDWWKPYIITIAILSYILPTVVITGCYTGICVVVWRKWKKSLRLSETNKDKALERLNGDKNKNSGLLPKAKVKSIKLTLIVCLAFFLCWTPYFICTLLDVYDLNTIETRLYMVLGMLYPLNSACNPIIFILFNLRLFLPRLDRRQKYTTYYDGGTQISSG